jgi:hypothetical protein
MNHCCGQEQAPALSVAVLSAAKEDIMSKSYAFAILVFLGSWGWAQQPSQAPADADNAALLKRIEELENRVRDLQQRVDAAASPNSVPSVAATAAPSSQEGAPASPTAAEGPPAGLPSSHVADNRGLRVRGFGQVEYIADDLHGDRPDLDVGNLTLLMTSEISSRLSALGELAFNESGYGGPNFSVDVARLLLEYQQNDYLKIGAGRYFTSIGYYNTAFYNADWAQTTMRRPVIVEFMNTGGILPTQRNGITLSGRLSSSDLGLHYVAEVGTGDMQRTDILQLGYEYFYKARTAYNLALFVRPQRLRGLQAGGSYYHDAVIPTSNGIDEAVVRQSIYCGYVVYNTPRWEFLNEAYLIHHAVLDSRNYNTPAFYSQVSRRLTSAIRPYFRYTWINAADANPVFGDVRRSDGIETGVRYNFSEWVGLKTEYDRLNIRDFQSINFIGSQLVFTF